MSWYKVDIRHGPGHQSRTVEYVYFDDEDWANTDEKTKTQEAFDMVVQHWWEWPIGDVTKVIELPEEVRQDKIDEYERKISSAKEMLAILDEEHSHRYYAILDLDNETVINVIRDDEIKPNTTIKGTEITKGQFDIFIEAENKKKPTFSQLTQVRCHDCENEIGMDERIKRSCWSCFVRPHKFLC